MVIKGLHLIFISLLSYIHAYMYEVHFYDDSTTKDTITLIKGQYKEITIVTTFEIETNQTEAKTILSISDNRFKISNETIMINTANKRVYHTSIGISCGAEISDEEYEKGINLQLATNNPEHFTIASCKVIVKKDKVKFSLVQSATTIPKNGYGAFMLNQSLLNVDEVPITLKTTAEMIPYISFESMIIKPNADQYGYYNTIAKYIGEVEKEYVSILVSIDSTQAQCFELTQDTFTVTINSDSVSDVNKDFFLISYVEDSLMTFSLLHSEKTIIPSTTHCVFIQKDIDFPSNEDIISLKEQESIPKSLIRYFKTVYGDNNKYIRFSTDSMDRSELYKIKCIIENNANENRQTKEIENLNVIDYSQIIQSTPRCINFIFDHPPANDFETKAKSYIINILSKEEIQEVKDIEVFSISNQHNSSYIKSICGMIDKASSSQMNSTSLNQMTNIYETFSKEGLSIIGIDDKCELSMINYHRSNKSLIVPHIVGDQKDKVIINMKNNLNQDIECFPLLKYYKDDSPDVFNNSFSFYVNKNSNDNYTISYNETVKVFNNEIYTLKLKCNSIIGLEFISRSFNLTHITHNNEFDCTKDAFLSRCLDLNKNIIQFNYAPSTSTFENINNSLVKYNSVTLERKKEYIVNTTIKSVESPDLFNLESFYYILKNCALVNMYLQYLDCTDDLNYTQCVEFKQEYQNKIIRKQYLVLTKNETMNVYQCFEDLDKHTIPSSNKTYAKYIEPYVATSMYQFLMSGNIPNTFTKESIDILMNLIQQFYQYYDGLFTLIKEHHSVVNYTLIIPYLYNEVIPHTQNIYRYMEAENISKDSNSTTNKGDYFIKYRKLFSSSLANYYILTNNHTVQTELFNFTYYPLNSNKRRLAQENDTIIHLNEINVTIPKSYLLSEENVTGLIFFEYDHYPLLTVNSLNQYSKVISIRKYSKNNQIIDEEYIPLSKKSISVQFNIGQLDKEHSYCGYFKDNALNNTNITTTVNKNGTISCECSFFGDVLIGNVPKKTNSKFWWILIISFLVLILILVIVIIICVCKKKKKNTNIDIKHGLIPESDVIDKTL